MLDGYKTYIAAIGLFCLAVYQATQGDFDAAAQSISEALAVFGLRRAISTTAR